MWCGITGIRLSANLSRRRWVRLRCVWPSSILVVKVVKWTRRVLVLLDSYRRTPLAASRVSHLYSARLHEHQVIEQNKTNQDTHNRLRYNRLSNIFSFSFTSLRNRTIALYPAHSLIAYLLLAAQYSSVVASTLKIRIENEHELSRRCGYGVANV